MMKELLPVGSVVLLQGATKKTIIIGIMQIKEGEENKTYDYIGVPYPEGFLGKDSAYLFNREHINDVIFTGYDNPERQGFLELAEQIFKEAAKVIEQRISEQKTEKP